MAKYIDIIKNYKELTGQTDQEIFAGEQAFGAVFIVEELLPKCIKEKKRIVWKDDINVGIDYMTYTLEKI